MRFDDRVIVLTGVAREGQVGEAVARAFAERGAIVVLLDRDAEQLSARAAELVAGGHRAFAFPCDLTDADAVEAVARKVGSAHGGRVDALVNAAGGFAMSGPLAESDVAGWHRMIAINLTTAFLATRSFLPLVRAGRGSVIYFASEAALPGGRAAGMSAYTAAKSGVVALMRAVAQEEGEHGVRANALAPGAIRTAANVEAMGDTAHYIEREEVADTILFLVSDRARAISGQILQLV